LRIERGGGQQNGDQECLHEILRSCATDSIYYSPMFG
jgi:hypothetical protein